MIHPCLALFPDVDLVVARPIDDRRSPHYFSGRTVESYGAACYQSGFNAALEQVKAKVEAMRLNPAQKEQP